MYAAGKQEGFDGSGEATYCVLRESDGRCPNAGSLTVQ